jgi:hypothetical protein
MWAWADSYDVFNTAALTGQQVSTAVRGMAVKSYAFGSPNVNSGDALSSCMLPGGASQATAALANANAVCMVNVNAVNKAPVKGLAVTVAVAAGMPPDPSTQVGHSICCLEYQALFIEQAAVDSSKHSSTVHRMQHGAEACAPPGWCVNCVYVSCAWFAGEAEHLVPNQPHTFSCGYNPQQRTASQCSTSELIMHGHLPVNAAQVDS